MVSVNINERMNKVNVSDNTVFYREAGGKVLLYSQRRKVDNTTMREGFVN
jgi:hypothetical protein